MHRPGQCDAVLETQVTSIRLSHLVLRTPGRLGVINRRGYPWSRLSRSPLRWVASRAALT